MDTTSFELRLPDTKLVRLKELLGVWKTKKSCIRKDLESLLGHLSHAASVVRPGRTFFGSYSLSCMVRGHRITSHVFLQGHGQTWHGGGAFCRAGMAPHSLPRQQLDTAFIQTHRVPLVVGLSRPVQVFYVSVAPTVAGVDISAKEM